MHKFVAMTWIPFRNYERVIDNFLNNHWLSTKMRMKHNWRDADLLDGGALLHLHRLLLLRRLHLHRHLPASLCMDRVTIQTNPNLGASGLRPACLRPDCFSSSPLQLPPWRCLFCWSPCSCSATKPSAQPILSKLCSTSSLKTPA